MWESPALHLHEPFPRHARHYRLFTGVRGRVILRSSQALSSRQFGQGKPPGFSPAYSHRPNTTTPTPTTPAATRTAINVATNTKSILAGLGQVLQDVQVCDDYASLLELYSPSLFKLAEGPGYRNPLATDHRAKLIVGVVRGDAIALPAYHPL